LAVIFDSTGLGRSNAKSVRIVIGDGNTKVAGSCYADFHNQVKPVNARVFFSFWKRMFKFLLVDLSVHTDKKAKQIVDKNSLELFECAVVPNVKLQSDLFFGFSGQTSQVKKKIILCFNKGEVL
jgi:hypothetical protein